MGEQQQEAERDWRGRGAGGGKSDSIRDRLGGKMRGRPDPNRPLDREELESQRPGTKPWDLNPEIVPRGKYFEVSS